MLRHAFQVFQIPGVRQLIQINDCVRSSATERKPDKCRSDKTRAAGYEEFHSLRFPRLPSWLLLEYNPLAAGLICDPSLFDADCDDGRGRPRQVRIDAPP